MPFNSFAFLFLFLPITATGYYLCARHTASRVAQIWLVLASLAFYSYAKPQYTLLLLGSILLNYAWGRSIAAASKNRSRARLTIALVLNLAVLSTFKYADFISQNLGGLWKPGVLLPGWAFPLGISFFTLQQIMYLVDCYEGLTEPSDLLTHAVFVSFFPSVISGPITRARQMVPQIRQVATTDAAKMSQAITLLAFGLFKKVVLGDSFGRLADAAFSNPSGLSTLEAWLSSFSYTFQIYFDFSGYTDLAIAAALLLGFTLPINFNTPYRSLSITEFWQRWHITLSQFITTYLYTPIMRIFSRVTLAASSLATIAAMTIAGLWHGPSWTFVLFGLFHGIALVVNQVWRRKVKVRIPAPLAWAATMLFVNTAFIFFRAPDVHAAVAMCRALLPHQGFFSLVVLKGSIRMSELGVIGLPLLVGVPTALLGGSSVALSAQLTRRPVTALAVASLILVSLLYMNSNLAKEFVYFKF